MTYKHILVAVDLSDESIALARKAAALACALNANLSLVHIDVNFNDIYTGFVNMNFDSTQDGVMESAQAKMKSLVQKIDYPVKETLVSSGDLCNEISTAIENLNVDLVICGHHQDFWSKLLSTSRQLINYTPIDMLIVPIKEDE